MSGNIWYNKQEDGMANDRQKGQPMNIIKNTLTIGAEKPFTFLHISDIHLAESDAEDSAERKAFAAGRKRDFALGLVDYPAIEIPLLTK